MRRISILAASPFLLGSILAFGAIKVVPSSGEMTKEQACLSLLSAPRSPGTDFNAGNCGLVKNLEGLLPGAGPNALASSCFQIKQDLHCPELFQGASPEESKKLLDCNDPQDVCSLMQFQSDRCFQGAQSGIVSFGQTIVQLPWQMMKSLMEFPSVMNDCLGDDSKKLEYLGALRPKDMSDETIHRMSCADILQFAQLKAELLLDKLQVRIMDFTTDHGRTPRIPEDLELSGPEEAALKWEMGRKPPFRMAACYKSRYRTEFLCEQAAITVANLLFSRALPFAMPKSAFLEELEQKLPGLKVKMGEMYVTLERGGKRVGELQFQKSGSEITIKSIDVGPHKRMGVSKALFEVLLKKFPEISSMKILGLAWDNRGFVDGALSGGASVTDAIKSTPSYKAKARFGFTEIDPDSVNSAYGYTIFKNSSQSAREAIPRAMTLVLSAEAEAELNRSDEPAP